jgi:uncharacterized protein
MKTKKTRSRKAVSPAAPKARHSNRPRAKATRRGSNSPRTSRSVDQRRRVGGTTPRAKSVATTAPERKLAPARQTQHVSRAALRIPPILLEGDQPGVPATGPGEKYALGPAVVAAPRRPEREELPEAYGTRKLTLLARDPHWLYAHWDLTAQQQRHYNALSRDRHLVVRVQPGTLAGHAASDIHVHPESRSWFIHVEQAATRYSVELGYYPPEGRWVKVAGAAPVTTPPDTVSLDKTLRFLTIPPQAPLPGSSTAATPGSQAEPLGIAAEGQRLPDALFQQCRTQQAQAGSADIAALLQGLVQGETLPESPVLPLPFNPRIQSISSPTGPEAGPEKSFWLNVNAELVLYGATEPDAALTVSSQPIALRPDGTFSFRFALPDGNYELKVSALSTEGDLRQARLNFARESEYEGEVTAAPQDPTLSPPPASDL